MAPVVGGKHFPYTSSGIAAARKARGAVSTSDGMMLGKKMKDKIHAKMAPKMQGMKESIKKRVSDRIL